MRILRLACLALSASALTVQAVVPVPKEIVPERIPGAKPRNVVFILADDHRYDAMSFLGHQFARTPVMDSIAANGVYLKNALVTTSLCSPSRASILTGLYTFRHRVIDNNRPIPPGTVYFPQYLQKAGYATAFIGKWHMGGESDAPQPGWDHWVSFRGQGVYVAPKGGYQLNVDGKHVPLKGYMTDELTDYAIAWLKQQKPAEKPFFLYLSHKAVHSNFTPAPRHEDLLANRALQTPRHRGRHRDELLEQTPLAARPAQLLARRGFPLSQRSGHRALLQALLRDLVRRGRQHRARAPAVEGHGHRKGDAGHLHGRQRLHVRRARLD